MKKKQDCAQKWISKSEAQTRRIGFELAGRLVPGSVLALYGELGAGKTTLVKGIARGLGVKKDSEVSSPTFVVIHEYAGKWKVHHLDWYRLEKVEGTDAAMAEECFGSDGVTLVEWPERGEALLPGDCVRVRLCHKNPTTRLIEIAAP